MDEMKLIFDENGWFESNRPQISSHNHGRVTHWMPLPEPPKGVS